MSISSSRGGGSSAGTACHHAPRCHPRTTAIREDRIVGVLDDWLSQLTDLDHRESKIAAVLAADTAQSPEPREVQAARRALRDLPVELDRVLAAIRAGMDPISP